MIAADPNVTFEFSFVTDQATPADKRPTFISRFLSAREYTKLDQMTDAAQAELDLSKRMDLLAVAVAGSGLVGWKNINDRSGQPVAFGPEGIARLPDILSFPELWELPLALLSLTRVQEEDRKKSARLSVGSLPPISASTIPTAAV